MARRCRPNIGLLTGVSFDVVDIDGGMKAWRPSIRLRRGTASTGTASPRMIPPSTGRLRRRARWHVLVGVTGFGNKAGLLPYVDWRGRDGYIVAPPSIHETGSQYRWVCGWSPRDQAVRRSSRLVDRSADRPRLNRSRYSSSVRDRRLGRAGGEYGRRALEIELGRVASRQLGPATIS